MSAPAREMFRCVICRLEAPRADGRPVDDRRYPSWRCADAAACAARFLAPREPRPDDAPRASTIGMMPCGGISPDSFFCIAAEGHDGAHVAYIPDGRVVRRWPHPVAARTQPDPDPSRCPSCGHPCDGECDCLCCYDDHTENPDHA